MESEAHLVVFPKKKGVAAATPHQICKKRSLFDGPRHPFPFDERRFFGPKRGVF